MTTCRDTVTLALQMSRVIPIGDTPETEEAAFGLGAMQAFYDHLIVSGFFGEPNDVLAVDTYTALEGDRIRHAGTVTVTIPTTYRSDGRAGTDRAPRDLALIETFNTTTNARAAKVWDNGWVDLLGLALETEAPLAGNGAFGLAACVALRIAETFGAAVGPATALSASNFMKATSFRTGTHREERKAAYF